MISILKSKLTAIISARLAASILLLAGASGCIYVQDSSSSFSNADLKGSATRELTGEIPADLQSIDVENRFGELEIVASDEPAGWTWALKVQAPTDAKAEEYAAAATCAAVQSGGRMRVTVELPNQNGQRSVNSDLTLRVPRGVAVRAENAFGRTRISGVTRDVEATGQNGSIELRDIGGKVRARTSFASLILEGAESTNLKNQNGKIDVRSVKGAVEAETSFSPLVIREVGGSVDARNQNGRVEVEDAKGNVEIKTSFAEASLDGIGGDVVVANQNGRISGRDLAGSVRAETSFAGLNIETAGSRVICRNQNGSIRIRVHSDDIDLVEASTAFSPIELHLPGTLKPSIQAKTSFGEIDSDFPILSKARNQEDLENSDPKGPRVILQNQNGKIRIVRERPAAAR